MKDRSEAGPNFQIFQINQMKARWTGQVHGKRYDLPPYLQTQKIWKFGKFSNLVILKLPALLSIVKMARKAHL
jgi:hypothetical protein